jgi:hypothetical protein
MTTNLSDDKREDTVFKLAKHHHHPIPKTNLDIIIHRKHEIRSFLRYLILAIFLARPNTRDRQGPVHRNVP